MSKLGAIPGTLGVYGTGADPAMVLSNPSDGEAVVRILGASGDDDTTAGPAPAGVTTINPSNVTINTVAGANVFTPGALVGRFFDTLDALFLEFKTIQPSASADDNAVGQIWVARNSQDQGVTFYVIDRPGGVGDMTIGQLADAASNAVVKFDSLAGEVISVPAAGVVLGSLGFIDTMDLDFVFPEVGAPFELLYALGELGPIQEGQWQIFVTLTALLPAEDLNWELVLQVKPDAGSFADDTILLVRAVSELENGVTLTGTGIVALPVGVGDTHRLLLRHDATTENVTVFRVEWWMKSFGLVL